MGDGTRPLDGVVVLDLTTALAGPYCTLLLAGLGARVIKVENPGGGDTSRNNSPYLGPDGPVLARRDEQDVSMALLDRNRDKDGVTLDLKHPDATAVFADLVRASDVLVTNFSTAALQRLGIDQASLHALNPRLVFCMITGFGADSPPDRSKAMDTIVQALSGLMMTSGDPEDPPVRVGVPLADVLTPLYSVIGILGALRRAERTGEGDVLDVSMLGSASAMVALEHWAALEHLGLPTRTGNVLPRLTPFGIFGTSDGHHVAVCAPTDELARGLFDALGLEPAQDERLSSRDRRVAHADEVNRMVETWTRARPREEVVRELSARGVPVAEVREPGEAVSDPRVLARGETLPIEHPVHGAVAQVYGTGMPVTSSRGGYGFERPAPGLGQHNDEVYGDLLGYAPDRIARLRRDHVI